MKRTRQQLDALLTRAYADPQLRDSLRATRQSDSPMTAFCQVAAGEGCTFTPGDLLTLGMEESGELMKSTNGGCPNPMEDWEDPYELFMIALE